MNCGKKTIESSSQYNLFLGSVRLRQTIRRLKVLGFVFLAAILPYKSHGQENVNSSSTVPLSDLFYHIGSNFIGSFTDNDGANHAVAAAATFGVVRSGLDWQWNTYANDKGISNVGFVSVAAGGLVPFVAPLGLYVYGRNTEDRRLQITGLALGQAALISVTISSAYKALTGRRPPDDREVPRGKTDYSRDFKFGFLNRGAYDGWPSSHTMNAFAMATTLMELYPESRTVSSVSLIYASLIGLGVSTNIHWLSDAVGGALIGYSIGKTVGASYREINGGGSLDGAVGFSVMPGGITLSYHF